MGWVRHWVEFAEVYAVFLVWTVVPLAYAGLFLYLKRRWNSELGEENAAD
ncbi:hypothetical protein K2X33_01060 [bacterium]|nr:hypothetical protein [bacterium]